jgi:hypothetical protein
VPASERHLRVLWWLAPALLAIVVRLVYVFTAAPRTLPFTDSLWYHVQGNLIADGHWFRNPFSFSFMIQDAPTAAHPPLYPLALAVASFFGFDSVRAHQVVGCIIGIGTVIGVSVLGRQLGGRRVGFLAGVLAAIYPPLWLNDGGVMSEGLFGLTIVLVLLACYAFVRRPGVWTAVAFGAAVGIAALTRAEAALLLGFLVIPVVWMRGKPRRFALLGVALVASALVMAPWVARNMLTFSRPVTLSTGDSILAGANCDAMYHGDTIGLWSPDCNGPQPPGDESVAASHWRRQGLRYASDHAGRVPLVVVARVGRIIDVYRPWQNATANSEDGRSQWTTKLALVSYWVLAPLAVVGVVLARRRSVFIYPFIALTAFVLLNAALFWGAERFQVPVEILIVLGAAFTFDAILQRFTEKAPETSPTVPQVDERMPAER